MNCHSYTDKNLKKGLVSMFLYHKKMINRVL